MAFADCPCIKEFVCLASYPVIVLHSNGVWPLQDRFWVTLSICILVRWVSPILVSSCANCDLNVSSSWLSDFLISFGTVCQGGVKVLGWTCSSNILCVVRLLMAVCGIWSMDSSIWPIHCPLLNVTCLCIISNKDTWSQFAFDVIDPIEHMGAWLEFDYWWRIPLGLLNCVLWWWLVWCHCA